jgi:hypothetical protein
MDVTQRLQPIQDKAYQVFTEVEGVSNNSCPGHKSIQVCKLREKHPSEAKKNPVSIFQACKQVKLYRRRSRFIHKRKSTVGRKSRLAEFCRD